MTLKFTVYVFRSRWDTVYNKLKTAYKQTWAKPGAALQTPLAFIIWLINWFINSSFI